MAAHCKLVYKISVKVGDETTNSTLAAFNDHDRAKKFAKRATELYRNDGLNHIEAVVTHHVEYIDYKAI